MIVDKPEQARNLEESLDTHNFTVIFNLYVNEIRTGEIYSFVCGAQDNGFRFDYAHVHMLDINFVAGPPFVPKPSPTQVILFKHANYGGAYKILESGSYPYPIHIPSFVKGMDFPDNSLSSLRVGSQAKATLFENAKFGGRAQEFTGDIPTLVGTVVGNDTVSSIKVTLHPRPNQAILFEHDNYEGVYRIVDVGEYDNMDKISFPNNSLSSIKVGSQAKVILYEDSGFGGNSQEFTEDIPKLDGTMIGHDNASSIKVKPQPKPKQAVLFEHENFEGAYRIVDVGEYHNMNKVGFADERLSSIKVGSQAKVSLYEHSDFKGRLQEFTEDIPTLVGTMIGNDTVSSLKVSTQP